MTDDLEPLAPPPIEEGRVDELFAGSRAVASRPGRSRQVLLLLALALPMNLAGLVCCTLVPGTLLTIWGWSITRRELAILEHGELPVQETLRLTRLERAARVMISACGVLLVIQAYLLTTGFYQGLLLRMDLWLATH